MFPGPHDPQKLFEALDRLSQVWLDFGLIHPEHPEFLRLAGEICEIAELVYENPEKAGRANCMIDITEIDLSHPLARRILGLPDHTEISQSSN